jgi:single-strand DNA-binding protein
MFMNSFSLRAVGHLANTPEVASKGDVTYTRLHLIGNDYAGKDHDGTAKEVVTGVWFVAFGMLAETLARTCRKGDQLILEARIRADNWIDAEGEKQYDYSFVVDGFKFGAPGKTKREELDAAHRNEFIEGARLVAAQG